MSAFEASKFKVTNEEFLEFVLSNGYEKRECWTDEGWEWVQFKQAKHPLFWVCPNGCKSGCGGKISSYTHCQHRHFTNDELGIWSTEPRVNDNTLEEIVRQAVENNETKADSFTYK